jgi:hypothetical protein
MLLLFVAACVWASSSFRTPCKQSTGRFWTPTRKPPGMCALRRYPAPSLFTCVGAGGHGAPHCAGQFWGPLIRTAMCPVVSPDPRLRCQVNPRLLRGCSTPTPPPPWGALSPPPPRFHEHTPMHTPVPPCQQTFKYNALECMLLVASLFILLAGMTFQSGVAEVGTGPHLFLTYMVAVVIVGCMVLFFTVLSVEVYKSVRFAARASATLRTVSAVQGVTSAEKVKLAPTPAATWTTNPLKGITAARNGGEARVTSSVPVRTRHPLLAPSRLQPVPPPRAPETAGVPCAAPALPPPPSPLLEAADASNFTTALQLAPVQAVGTSEWAGHLASSAGPAGALRKDRVKGPVSSRQPVRSSTAQTAPYAPSEGPLG